MKAYYNVYPLPSENRDQFDLLAHTTPPVYPQGRMQIMRGNRNRHARRWIDSRLRTPGRMARFLRRQEDEGEYGLLWIADIAATVKLFREAVRKGIMNPHQPVGE